TTERVAGLQSAAALRRSARLGVMQYPARHAAAHATGVVRCSSARARGRFTGAAASVALELSASTGVVSGSSGATGASAERAFGRDQGVAVCSSLAEEPTARGELVQERTCPRTPASGRARPARSAPAACDGRPRRRQGRGGGWRGAVGAGFAA